MTEAGLITVIESLDNLDTSPPNHKNPSHLAALRRRFEAANQGDEGIKWSNYVDMTGAGLRIIKPLPSKHLDKSAILLGVAFHLIDLESSIRWAWGDALNWALMGGDESSPPALYRLIFGNITEAPAESTVRSWRNTAERWTFERRLSGKGATISHHRVLNPIERDEDQDRLIAMSKDNGWSVTRLREERDKMFPELGAGERRGGNSADREAESEQTRQELMTRTWEAEQRALLAEQRLREAGLSLGPVDPGAEQAGVYAPTQEEFSTLPEADSPKGKLIARAKAELGDDAFIALPKPPGVAGLLLISGGQLGYIDPDGDTPIYWYDEDDPAGKLLAWEHSR